MTITTEIVDGYVSALEFQTRKPTGIIRVTAEYLEDISKMLSSLAAERDALRAENEKLRATRKWNIERDGEDLLICEGDHEKHEACAAKRWVKADTLKAENARLREALRLANDAIEFWLTDLQKLRAALGEKE